MLETAESMARDNPFMEFRLDYLKQPLAAIAKIRRFLETHQYVTRPSPPAAAPQTVASSKDRWPPQFDVL